MDNSQITNKKVSLNFILIRLKYKRIFDTSTCPLNVQFYTECAVFMTYFFLN